MVSLSAGLHQDHDAQGAYLTPSQSHALTVTPCHPPHLTSSHCHALTVSCPVTPSHTHLVIPSPLHNVFTLSHPHSRFHICTLPPTHTLSHPRPLTPSRSHTLALSHPHPLRPSHSHTLTLSHPRPLTPSPPHPLTPLHHHLLTPTLPALSLHLSLTSSLALPSLPTGQSCPGVRL